MQRNRDVMLIKQKEIIEWKKQTIHKVDKFMQKKAINRKSNNSKIFKISSAKKNRHNCHIQ